MIIPAPLLAIGSSLLGVVRAIPVKVWIGIGVVAAIAIAAWRFDAWLDRRDERARVDERAKVNAVWEERKREADARFAAEMNRKRNEVSDWVLAGIARRDALALELRGAELALIDSFTELRNRRTVYVTQAAIDSCGLTRGVVMQFNSGAARANGTPDPSPAAQPAPGVADEPAGIALDRYTGAVEDTQRALGSCRAQVFGWQRHWSDVSAWYQGLARILDTCFPKGAAP